MSKTNSKIDVYIEENYDQYDLKFIYNDHNPTYSYKDKESRDLAIAFKYKYLNNKTRAKNITYTEENGSIYDDTSLATRHISSIISSINGLKNIDNSIVYLISTCIDPEINADLTFYLNEKEYPIIGDLDNKLFRRIDLFRTKDKGMSVIALDELVEDMKMLDENNIKIAQ